MQIAARHNHALLCAADGSAMAFGDSAHGKLGFASRVAFVPSPRSAVSDFIETVRTSSARRSLPSPRPTATTHATPPPAKHQAKAEL